MIINIITNGLPKKNIAICFRHDFLGNRECLDARPPLEFRIIFSPYHSNEFRDSIPVASSLANSSCVNISDTLNRIAECRKGRFDVRSVLKTREWPELFAFGFSFNSYPFMVYLGWNIYSVLIRYSGIQRTSKPTSFAMAWREKWFSGACSSSMIDCSDDTQTCELPRAATTKAAPSA